MEWFGRNFKNPPAAGWNILSFTTTTLSPGVHHWWPDGCGTTHPFSGSDEPASSFTQQTGHLLSPACCDTAPKDFLKSRWTPSTFPSSREWVSLPQMEIRLVNQDLSLTNACWLGLTVLYVLCGSAQCLVLHDFPWQQDQAARSSLWPFL